MAYPQGWYAYGSDECIPSVNPSLNNTTGFSARAAGRYGGGNGTMDAYHQAGFWTSAPKSSTSIWAYYKEIVWDETYVNGGESFKTTALSVRCLRDLPVQH